MWNSDYSSSRSEIVLPPDLVSAQIVQCHLHYFWYFHVVGAALRKNLCMFMTGVETTPGVTEKHLVLRRGTGHGQQSKAVYQAFMLRSMVLWRYGGFLCSAACHSRV